MNCLGFGKTVAFHLLDDSSGRRESDNAASVRCISGADRVHCVAFACPCLTVDDRQPFGSGRVVEGAALLVAHGRALRQRGGGGSLADVMPPVADKGGSAFKCFMFGLADGLRSEAVKLLAALSVIQRHDVGT